MGIAGCWRSRARSSRSQTLLLLDEPAAGLNVTEAGHVSELIARIRAAGTTVILVEHHMDVVMRVSDEITVLNYGRKLAHGTPGQIQDDPEVDRSLSRPFGGERTVLALDGVIAAYDDVICLRGVSLEVRRGEIVTLIGANGAGKSTTLKTISGLLTPRSGTIEFEGAAHCRP